ncbi:hypothetical protein GIB67_037466 [Kingdonia uniflora]|uniref:Glycosyltransferase n=1 Tax=Kingdonia uniflora TaxID=39325 RepID=A0A7J7ND97_9MAGN|nr:hypothetical protein GIB67_037823 [Kingdonia uniflora]KAF6164952.1 hypothetical protein GIB67_037466 [Kingdonia uniflora]
MLGATILHGVDATKMKLHTDLKMRKFDRIIYNFPHAGFHRKEDDAFLIRMHKKLVLGLFKNASGMLRPDGEVHVNHKTSPPFDRWNIEELASMHSLGLIECVDFRIEDYPDATEKFGVSGYDFEEVTKGTLRTGFARYMNETPNADIRGYIMRLEELHRMSIERLAWLRGSQSTSWFSSLRWTWIPGFRSASSSSTTHFTNDTNLLPLHMWQDEGKLVQLKGPGKKFNVFYVSPRVRKGEIEKLDKLEAGLGRIRASIREAVRNQNHLQSLEDPDYVPQGKIYRNDYIFHRSYLLMEKLFKIFVYEEGEPPLFHNGPCNNIYSTEGLFIHLMEINDKFRTKDPDEAHVYFLPFSVVMIIEYLFHPIIRDKAVLERTIGDYVRIISEKYPYWNRSLGADHFMLSCHDWGPRATWYVPQLYFNSIRVLCNANTSERFNPKKDASFPEINLITGEIAGLIGGPPPSSRSILGFFAGGLHGRIRAILLQYWKEKDNDLQIYEALPEGVSYQEMMNKSKYCICPSGYEVASPRIVEAIYAECVPVLISQDYVLPFSDVLDWDAFSVQVPVSEIPNLKRILMDIPEDEYLRMHERVKQVQRHFVVNDPPRRYDVFHMILHSIWLRRLNVQISR